MENENQETRAAPEVREGKFNKVIEFSDLFKGLDANDLWSGSDSPQSAQVLPDRSKPLDFQDETSDQASEVPADDGKINTVEDYLYNHLMNSPYYKTSNVAIQEELEEMSDYSDDDKQENDAIDAIDASSLTYKNDTTIRIDQHEDAEAHLKNANDVSGASADGDKLITSEDRDKENLEDDREKSKSDDSIDIDEQIIKKSSQESSLIIADNSDEKIPKILRDGDNIELKTEPNDLSDSSRSSQGSSDIKSVKGEKSDSFSKNGIVDVNSTDIESYVSYEDESSDSNSDDDRLIEELVQDSELDDDLVIHRPEQQIVDETRLIEAEPNDSDQKITKMYQAEDFERDIATNQTNEFLTSDQFVSCRNDVESPDKEIHNEQMNGISSQLVKDYKFISYVSILRSIIDRHLEIFSNSGKSRTSDLKENVGANLVSECKRAASCAENLSRNLEKIEITLKSYSHTEMVANFEKLVSKFDVFYHLENYMIEITKFLIELHNRRGAVWKLLEINRLRSLTNELVHKKFLDNHFALKQVEMIHDVPNKEIKEELTSDSDEIHESTQHCYFEIPKIQSHFDFFFLPYYISRTMLKMMNHDICLKLDDHKQSRTKILKNLETMVKNQKSLMETPDIKDINILSNFECSFKSKYDEKFSKGYVILTADHIYMAKSANMVFRNNDLRTRSKSSFKKAIDRSILKARLGDLQIHELQRIESAWTENSNSLLHKSMWNQSEIENFVKTIDSLRSISENFEFSIESTKDSNLSATLLIADPIHHKILKKLNMDCKVHKNADTTASKSLNSTEVINYALRLTKTLYLDQFDTKSNALSTVLIHLTADNVSEMSKKLEIASGSELKVCIMSDSTNFPAPCSPILDLKSGALTLRSTVLKVSKSLALWLRIFPVKQQEGDKRGGESEWIDFTINESIDSYHPFVPTVLEARAVHNSHEVTLGMKITLEYQANEENSGRNDIEAKKELDADPKVEPEESQGSLPIRKLPVLQLSFLRIEDSPKAEFVYRSDSCDQEELAKVQALIMKPGLPNLSLFESFNCAVIAAAMPQLLLTYPILKFSNKRQFMALRLIVEESKKVDKIEDDELSSNYQLATKIIQKLHPSSLEPTLTLFNHILYMEGYESHNRMNASSIITCLASSFYDNNPQSEEEQQPQQLRRQTASRKSAFQRLSLVNFNIFSNPQTHNGDADAKNSKDDTSIVNNEIIWCRRKIDDIRNLETTIALSLCLIRELRKYEMDDDFKATIKSCLEAAKARGVRC